MNLFEILLPGTGSRGRTYQVWQAMEERVAGMDDQDALIADLVRQRDEALALANAAGAQVEEFRARVTQAEERASLAEADATRLRADLANAQSITIPMYPLDTPTQELPVPAITPVMPLHAAFAGAA